MTQSDARKPSGFDRDILEWNIPEGGSVFGEMVRQNVFSGMNEDVAL
jgi:hypothetical protein